MKAINSAGSPPILKNSRSASRMKSRNARCVASRTRCPCAFSSFPRATNGCMSPRDPITWMTMLRFSGKYLPSSAGTLAAPSVSSAPSSSDGIGVRWRLSSPAILGLCSLIRISKRPSPVEVKPRVSSEAWSRNTQSTYLTLEHRCLVRRH